MRKNINQKERSICPLFLDAYTVMSIFCPRCGVTDCSIILIIMAPDSSTVSKVLASTAILYWFTIFACDIATDNVGISINISPFLPCTNGLSFHMYRTVFLWYTNCCGIPLILYQVFYILANRFSGCQKQGELLCMI